MSSQALTPEYIAANSRGVLIPKMSVVAALATVLAAFRIGLRLHRKVSLWLDDWLLVLSVAFLWALYAICVLTVVDGGIGRHLIALIKTSPHTLDNMEVYFYSGDFLYASTLAIVKCSILAMYWRIFPTRFIRRGTVFIGSLVVAWYLGCVFVSIFQCKPIYKAWRPLTPGTCVNHVHVFMGKAIPNFTIDFFILCLPVVEILKLQVWKPQKIALVAVFAFGALACVSSVVRFKIVYTSTVHAKDVTWILPSTFLWTMVEVSMAIISACLPPMGPVLSWAMVHLSSLQLSLSGKSGKKESNQDDNVVTIGGGSKGRKIRPRDPDTLNLTKGSTTTIESSFEQIQAVESQEFDFGFAPERHMPTQGTRTHVHGGAPGSTEYVPMHEIAVKTEISSQERRSNRRI